jgi:hexosaminidase
VEVVPEIDIPGHSYATLRALPHLVEDVVGAAGDEEDAEAAAAAAAAAAAQGIGSFPNNCLNPALPQTLEFLTHVLDEVVELFAPCKRVHLGCDEVPRGAFAASPACRQLAKREGYLSPTGPG